MWKSFRSPERQGIVQKSGDAQIPQIPQILPSPPRQTSPSRPSFLQAGGEGRGRRGRRNSILSRLAEHMVDEAMEQLLVDARRGSGPSRCHASDDSGGPGQGVEGPRLLVEHVSQLSEPDCKFCQHPTPHLDCSKINIYSGGTLFTSWLWLRLTSIVEVTHCLQVDCGLGRSAPSLPENSLANIFKGSRNFFLFSIQNFSPSFSNYFSP